MKRRRKMKLTGWHWALIAGGVGIGALLLFRRPRNGFETVDAKDGQYEFGRVKTGRMAGIGQAAQEAIFVENKRTGRIIQIVGPRDAFRVEVAPGWTRIAGRHTPIHKGLDTKLARRAIQFSLETQGLDRRNDRHAAKEEYGVDTLVRREGSLQVSYGREMREA